jgi:hypothetical protein
MGKRLHCVSGGIECLWHGGTSLSYTELPVMRLDRIVGTNRMALGMVNRGQTKQRPPHLQGFGLRLRKDF